MVRLAFTAPARSAIAAVRAESGSNDLLAAFACSVEERGYSVRGLIQRPRTREAGTRYGLALVDVHAGTRYAITQNLGPGSRACRVDLGGIAEASAVLRAAVDEGADLVVVNRFGKLEAHGGGLATEMLAVMAAGIPLLTTVSDCRLSRWREFTGGGGEMLAPNLDNLQKWWRGAGP